MPFNFPLHLKQLYLLFLLSLPFLTTQRRPISSVCSSVSPWKRPLLSLQNKPSLAFFRCATTPQTNNMPPPTCSDCTVCPFKWTASTKHFMDLSELYTLLWHFWLPLWSFNSQNSQTSIPQWLAWTVEVCSAWVCQGQVFIMTRMISRRESVLNINTQETAQRREKHLHSATSLPL